MSNASFAQRMARCALPTTWGGSGSCQRWHFCSRCAYARKHATWKTFLPAFDGRQFIFVTLGIKQAVVVQGEHDFSAVLPIWNAINGAISSAVKERVILGAFCAEELSIRSFFPLLLNPHLHAVFHVDDSSDAFLDMIRGFLLGAMPDAISSISSVKAGSLKGHRDFAYTIAYPTKEIDIVMPYQSAEGRQVPHEILNRNCEVFFRGWDRTMYGRTAIRKFGTFHHASAGYIGTKGWEKKAREEYVKSFWSEERTRRFHPENSFSREEDSFEGALR